MTPRILTVTIVLVATLASPLAAQRRGVDVTYGRWLAGSGATTYAATYYRPLLGPMDYGLGVTHLRDEHLVDDRTLTAGELSIGIGRDGRGPYAVGALGLGMRHVDRNLDLYWSAGGGYAVSLFRVLSLGVEARYRAEDRRTQGFWHVDPEDRRGLMLQGRLAVSFAAASRGSRTRPQPSPRAPVLGAPGGPVEGDDALRYGVVQAALEAMGTPYVWGGSDENGFDCSGLIQYAYGEYGVILPRNSRDQARTGVRVDRDPAALRPGDILGFSLSGGGISHVGLYVGEGDFIHSGSGGVTLSSLAATDAEGQYWLERWRSATRVVN